RPPPGIDLALLAARRAVQFSFIRELDADLADVVRAFVVGALSPLLDPHEIAVVDAPDVPDDVRGELRVRVLAEEPRLDLHAGKPIPVHGESPPFIVGKTRADRQAFEALRLIHELLETLAIARLDLDYFRQRLGRLGGIRGARRV